MESKRKRLYKENAIMEDLYHFEMGNELGAHLEEEKQKHEKCYQKERPVVSKKQDSSVK